MELNKEIGDLKIVEQDKDEIIRKLKTNIMNIEETFKKGGILANKDIANSIKTISFIRKALFKVISNLNI